MLYQSGQKSSAEGGPIESIRKTEQAALPDIIRSTTMTFTADGQRLYILDNRVQNH